ncbi:helix-turn-helix domain-containing protein [Streptomyces sp. NPDC059957]|uniref:helix-turn-helix transcriptional regulator n=1 Tax=unclassified Streptomyces TaxID=2593676 RepID=UPI00365FB378
METSIEQPPTAHEGSASFRSPPGPSLRGMVLGYHGYRLPQGLSRCRLEIPDGVVTVVVNLAGELHLTAGGERAGASSFLSGLRTTPTRGTHAGGLHGIEVTFTPLGAYQVFGIPMRQFTENFVDLTDVLGPTAPNLVERLWHARSWPERFALLDAVFSGLSEHGGVVSPQVRSALALLRSDRQPGALARICREVGWSPRHLRSGFSQQVGLSPKAVTRVARLQRALRLQTMGLDGARVAAHGGFHDQAHCIREFRAMTGLTPSRFALLRAGLPAGSPLDRVAGRVTSLLLEGG